MENIVKELVELNQRDCLDIMAILVPIILSIIIIVQNKIYEHKNVELQKRIHNREWSQQYHNEILLLYNTYYEFCDAIILSGFRDYVKCGNVNAASVQINDLSTLRMNIGRRKDLAKLLFGKKNPDLYNTINMCFENEISIIDKYVSYVLTGRLLEVSENAWNTVCAGNMLQRYNYVLLQQYKIAYDNFMKLCHSDELMEIEKLLEKDERLHSYDNFDKFFENYFSIDEIS